MVGYDSTTFCIRLDTKDIFFGYGQNLGYGWIRIGYSWIRLDTANFADQQSWIRLDTVGYGWIRLDTVGYGWIRLDTVGYVGIRSDTF